MGINTATKLILISRIAQERKTEKFTSLMHLLNAEYFLECFKELKKKKAAGIDGRTLESYSEEEIKNILEQTAILIKQKRYRPKPVRSVDIAKDNGKIRTLGIPTVVDKVVQQAITKILQAIYEPNFLDVSYGYRPGKDAHSCLKEVNHMIMQKKVNWIIDADISGYFDNIDHTWMMRCLTERIADPNFKSLIMRFLKAGIMKDSISEETPNGTPQGGIISPILANIYLHYVLDLWFEKQEKKQIQGYTQLIRYADDFIIGVQNVHEAKQILTDIEKRIQKFGLTLSVEKTGIKEFGRFAKENQNKHGKRKPETFDFLGFTHYCTNTRDGRFMVTVKTSQKKMNKSIMAMDKWLKGIRNHKQLKEIWPLLKSKLQGHYNYYGVSGNIEEIKYYYRKTQKLIFRWMNRRSQKVTWNSKEFRVYLSQHALPEPKLTYAIFHTW
jgi:RNA-directed DNA polymerase